MSQDKFLVYLIKRGVNSIDRLYTDTKGVRDILSNRTKNQVRTVLRSATNQFAFLLEDIVCWRDVKDEDTDGRKWEPKLKVSRRLSRSTPCLTTLHHCNICGLHLYPLHPSP